MRNHPFTVKMEGEICSALMIPCPHFCRKGREKKAAEQPPGGPQTARQSALPGPARLDIFRRGVVK
ncbi:hypothetical protein B5G03_12260 [Gemmiger sp. An50]|nr:hypothetical protein B5G03_12260 [Gemmiger sp. An50]